MKILKMKIKGAIVIILIICSIFTNACSNSESKETEELVDNLVLTESVEDIPAEDIAEEALPEEDLNIMDENSETPETAENKNDAETMEFNEVLYNIIQFDGGNLSGER